jgi:hypothetical protein
MRISGKVTYRNNSKEQTKSQKQKCNDPSKDGSDNNKGVHYYLPSLVKSRAEKTVRARNTQRAGMLFTAAEIIDATEKISVRRMDQSVLRRKRMNLSITLLTSFFLVLWGDYA